MLHIEYQISEDDFVAAGKLVLRRRSRWKRYLLGVVLTLGFACILYSAYWLWQREFVAGGVWLIYGVFLLCIPLLRNRAFRRMYRRRPSAGKPLCVEIDDYEVHLISPEFDSRTSWTLYDAFAEDDLNFVLLQQGRLHYLPIPKRQIAPDQLHALRVLVSAHVPQL